MTSKSYLEWLPLLNDQFRERCATINAMAGNRGSALRELARYDLGPNELHRLGACVQRAVVSNDQAPLEPIVLGIVSNSTTDLFASAIAGAGARHGLAITPKPAPYGLTLQSALDPQSDINTSQPHAILFALDYRAFFSGVGLAENPSSALKQAQIHLSELLSAFRQTSKATLIVQTLATPPEKLFGGLDCRTEGCLVRLTAQFNEWVATDVAGSGVVLLDVASLAADVGRSNWFDAGQWFTAKLPFAQRFVPLYADCVARTLAAVRGKGRKVLVLDMDNTLWGGVIGDDGIDGIALGQGSPVGEAYVELQKAALALKERGVLLALCSKNTEEVALNAVRNHPDMILKESNFSAFQINWNDKASNLESLAKRLSLGLDSFVFFDDNPFEREQVRQALPMVFVPELPSDPTSYARILLTSGVFESVAFSEEDKDRSAQYAANAQRETLLTQSRDLKTYLSSLQMKAIFTSGGSNGWQRFTQLINKSNQFNLTTKRYSEAEVLAFVADPRALALQVRLTDRFGDNGMISSIICSPDDNDWLIDTWVMSCRVLGRGVEEAVLNEIVERAKAAHIPKLHGIFRPTDRNQMVSDHYQKLGFTPNGDKGAETHWVLDVNAYSPRETPIAVERAL